MKIPEIQLNDGNIIPAIGLGVGIIQYPTAHNLIECIYNKFIRRRIRSRNCQKSIESAIEIGYKLIDTSAAYNNLTEISHAIQHCQRPEIYIQSRVSNRAQFSGKVKEEFYRSMELLKCDYLDVLQLHWPVPNHFQISWENILGLKEEGLVKSIGVANFNIHHLKSLMSCSSTIPAINQIEVHPLFTNRELIQYSQSKGIIVQAYSPLARMDDRLIKSSRLNSIAKSHNTTIASVILRWHYQNNVVPIVKSQNPVRQKNNISIFDYTLDESEMQIIDSININARRRFDPDNCEFENL